MRAPFRLATRLRKFGGGWVDPAGYQELKFATVVADLAADESFEAVQEDYQLTREQVIAALRYAAHLAAPTPPAVSEAS